MGGVLHGYSITDSPGTGADAAHNKTRKKKKNNYLQQLTCGSLLLPEEVETHLVVETLKWFSEQNSENSPPASLLFSPLCDLTPV
jgi:hypothetical protein